MPHALLTDVVISCQHSTFYIIIIILNISYYSKVDRIFHSIALNYYFIYVNFIKIRQINMALYTIVKSFWNAQ